MRRFLTLVVLLLFTIPFGVSISGCSKKEPVIFCNGGDSGAVVGQVFTITLQPQITGISLNQGEIGQVSAPTASDCKGTSETVSSYTYATFDVNGKPDLTIADVNPTNGHLCAGTWNRNTGGGIADFTTCNITGKSGVAYITASGSGASSNSIPIFVHPVVTSVVLGAPTAITPNACGSDPDPATNCSPAYLSSTQTTCTISPINGCCTTAPPTTASFNAVNGCISQGSTSQLAARVYAGSGSSQTNISCLVGNLAYSAQPSTVVTINANGVATAQQPGAALISANISQAGSSAGFFSTCPPTNISLTVPLASPNNKVTVNPNNTQPLNALATDKNGTVLTGVALEFVSTTPTTIPVSTTGAVTPTFPDVADITAICLPPSCNPAPINQIGLYGNGLPITSNPVTVTAPGTTSTSSQVSTVLYIASTASLYLVPVDFTTNLPGSPVRLPYQPNSMVISDDGSTIYMGSSLELMTFSTATNALITQDTTVTGSVQAISPDNTTLVFTDPLRQLIYLYSSTGAVTATYGGIATHAQFTPDSQIAYITLGGLDPAAPAGQACPAGDVLVSTSCVKPNNQLLVHSSLIGWYLTSAANGVATPDVAVTVPSVGAFFSGTQTTARSYCPITSVINGSESNPSTTNVYFPDAGVTAPTSDIVAATNDGLHILGATVTPKPTLTDIFLTANGLPTGACPSSPPMYSVSTVLNQALPGVTATAITGVLPTSDSSTAFVTYTGSGGVLPTYAPSTTGGAGTIGSIQLATTSNGTPIAPVAGAISANNQMVFVGTTGDNAVHILTRGTNGLYKDVTAPIIPKLPDVNNNIVTPNLLVQRPRKAVQ